jgi:hypothetical protein
MNIDELGLTVRCRNCLVSEDINTVNILLTYSEKELIRIPNFGYKSLDEVTQVLDGLGLKLRPNGHPFPSRRLQAVQTSFEVSKLAFEESSKKMQDAIDGLSCLYHDLENGRM